MWKTPRGRDWGPSTIYGNWRRGTGIPNNELYVGRLLPSRGLGWRPDGTNLRRHVKRYREHKRERFLSEEETWQLGEVLREAEEEMPSAVAAFREEEPPVVEARE